MCTMGRNSWSALFEESWWVAWGEEAEGGRKKKRGNEEECKKKGNDGQWGVFFLN